MFGLTERASDLAERVKEAAAAQQPLRIVGAGSKSFLGRQSDHNAEPLIITDYRGLIHYEPSELVVTAAAGTALSDLIELLKAERQMLGFEPPLFGAGATVGGTVACGLSGPRRPYAGALRDFVLGVKIINGRGQILRFGGEVMKNVAGYDVSRLMCGASGTLGVLLEISFRLLPLAVAEQTLQFEFSQAQALEKLSEWGLRPYPLSAAAWHDRNLRVRLSGAQSAVDRAGQQLGGDTLAARDAEQWWLDLREQSLGFFTSDAPLWRISLAPASAPLSLPSGASELIDWGGALRWVCSDAPAAEFFALAEKAGGHAQLFRGGVRSGPISQPLAPAMLTLQQRLKRSFDPACVLNPGSLHAEL